MNKISIASLLLTSISFVVLSSASTQMALANSVGDDCKTALVDSGVVAQDSLLQQFDAVMNKKRYAKIPIFAVEIPAAPTKTLPEFILKNLGTIDQISSDSYLAGRKYILLNYVLKQGQVVPDFYPISEESFNKAGYVIADREEVKKRNPRLAENISQLEGVKLIGLQKKDVVEMVRTEALGYDDKNELKVMGGLKAPTVQTKPPGTPAFLAKGQHGVYLINTDTDGNPLGYVPHADVPNY